MTKKLIRNIIYFILLFIVVRFLLPIYYKSCIGVYHEVIKNKVSIKRHNDFPMLYTIEQASEYVTWYSPFIFIVGTCVSVVFIFYLWFSFIDSYKNGSINSFFQKYTDPKLQQFCNWVNRRNKTEC